MLFDCGVPYSKIKKELYGIRYLLITHAHGDHLNKRTFEAINRDFPRVVTVGNWDVGYKVRLNKTVGDETVLKLADRTITSFPCLHDVPTHGYVVSNKNHSIIYATDTATLEHAPKIKYDLMLLESNHDETKIEQIRFTSRKEYGYDAWKGAMRHLSTQKSKAFYYLHRRNPQTEWVELHKSERFY